MITNKKYNDIAILIVVLLGSILLYWLLKPVLSHLCFFEVDDLNSTLDSYPLWREENGRYVCNFISRVVVVYIPKLLGIHLQNAANTIGMFGYIIILSLLFTISSMFYCLKDRNPIIYASLWTFAGLFFYQYLNGLNENSVFYFTLFSFQYGYVLAMVFALTFLLFVYKYIVIYIDEKRIPEINKTSKILLCILAFCAGNSTQAATYTILVSLILIYFSFLIKNKFSFSKTNGVFFNKTTTPILMSYFIGFLCMVLCPGFWIEVSWRHSKSASDIINNFIPFLKEYYFYVIKRYLDIYKLIFILLLGGIVKNVVWDKEKITDAILNSFIFIMPVIGMMAYFFTLIAAGRTFGESKFWVMEPFYHFCFFMFLSSVICLFIGNLCKNSNVFIKILLIVVIFFDVYKIYGTNKNVVLNKLALIQKDIIECRQEVYMNEKIMMTSIYTNNPIYILCDEINIFNEPNRYLKNIYNIKTDKYIICTTKEEAMKQFYDMGGSFSEEELEQNDFRKMDDILN